MAPNGGRTKDFGPGQVGPAIARLDQNQITKDLSAVAEYALKLPSASKRLYVAGFCWGGGPAFTFATNRRDVTASLVFYGPPPSKESMGNISGLVYGFYGGMDDRESC